ncbi:MAG: TlpA family protein disulfide reductase [Clostridia bacterium]|nr:TlpA family protein disulfide reductase [Clostridia bacterium]
MSEVKKYTFLFFIVLLIFLIGCTPIDTGEPVKPGVETDDPENNNEGLNDGEQLDEAGVFEGDEAKDFYLEDNKGNGIRLSETFGEPIILNFWTSWSVESESVNMLLSECYETYKDKVQFISLNITAVEGNNLEYVIKHIRLKGYEFPIYFDLEGEVAEKYWIRSFPATYLIDKNGYVSKIYIGEIDKEELFDEIKKIEE